MFLDSESLITTKRGITAGQRQCLNPEQKIGGKHQEKTAAVSYRENSSGDKWETVSWVSWFPWWSGYSIQIRREKNWKKHATSPPYTMNQIEAEKQMRMTWTNYREYFIIPAFPGNLQACVNALRLSCRSLTCNLRVDGTSCGMQVTNALNIVYIWPETHQRIQKDLKKRRTPRKQILYQKGLLLRLQIVLHHRTARHPKDTRKNRPPINNIRVFHVHIHLLASTLQLFLNDFFHILRCLSLWPRWSSSQCFWGQVFQPLHQPAGWS